MSRSLVAYTVDAKSLETMLDVLCRLARGRICCKDMQREGYVALNAFRKQHPELFNALVGEVKHVQDSTPNG